MNSKGSRVILILVVGLTAFSSAMKELNEVRQFGLQLNQFVAEWSEKLAPAEIPPPVLAKVEDETTYIEEPDAAPPAVKQTKSCKFETLKAKKARQHDVDPVQFEVRVPAVYDFSTSSSSFKFRTHKFNFKISPRDREMLKTLNRSINLRIAS